ncbi:MAG: hypothetical protein ACREDI_10160, partial [Roseiarcus sp.]
MIAPRLSISLLKSDGAASVMIVTILWGQTRQKARRTLRAICFDCAARDLNYSTVSNRDEACADARRPGKEFFDSCRLGLAGRNSLASISMMSFTRISRAPPFGLARR